jgi:hypothetical protein
MSPVLWRETRSAVVWLDAYKDRVTRIRRIADELEARIPQLYKEGSGGVGTGWRRPQGNGGGSGSYNHSTRDSVPVSAGKFSGAATQSGDPMEWEPTPRVAESRRARWVDEQERNRRRAGGLCLRCGGRGHRVAECAALPANRPQTISIGAQGGPVEVPEEGLEPLEKSPSSEELKE